MAKCGIAFVTGIISGLLLAGAGAAYLNNKVPTPKGQTIAAIPDATGSRKLALDTTLRFGEAIKNHDLAGFRASTASEFQKAFSLPAFEHAFRGFIEQNINLLAVSDMKPTFTKRELDLQSGTLRLAGWFPTQPSRLSFNYNYTRSAGDWRLSGIDVSVQPQ